MKSPKNKTIDISVEEGKQYLERCITVTEPVQLSTVLNKTIVGDCFDVLSNLPHQSVDLAIVDPRTIKPLDKELILSSLEKRVDSKSV